MNGSDGSVHSGRPEEVMAAAAHEVESAEAEKRDEVYTMGWWKWVRNELRHASMRRRFLVNWKSQLTTALMVTGLVFFLLVLLNVTFAALRNTETSMIIASSPNVADVLARNDRTEMILSLIGSAVIVMGTFLMTIFETHRTAGAAFNVARNLGRVADGDYGTQVRLRRTDNLHELMEPFNNMTESLRDRAAEQADTLDRLAVQLESGSVGDVAAQLREMASSTRGPAQSDS